MQTTRIHHPLLINMYETWEILSTKTKVAPKTVIDVGAYNGKDGVELAGLFNVPEADTCLIEAHPEMAAILRQRYPEANVIERAVSSETAITVFHSIDRSVDQNHGVSSLRRRDDGRAYKHILLEPVTMDEVVARHKLKAPFLVKVDTEGCTFESVQSFGTSLSLVHALHIECEHTPVWEEQRTYADVERLLIVAGFICLCLKMNWPQSDSVWVRRELLKKP